MAVARAETQAQVNSNVFANPDFNRLVQAFDGLVTEFAFVAVGEAAVPQDHQRVRPAAGQAAVEERQYARPFRVWLDLSIELTAAQASRHSVAAAKCQQGWSAELEQLRKLG
jgi:hypothetical protein